MTFVDVRILGRLRLRLHFRSEVLMLGAGWITYERSFVVMALGLMGSIGIPRSFES